MSSLRKTACLLLAFLAAAAMLGLPCAALAAEEEPIVELSNRYADLESLQEDEDATENVVTTTRVGVLTAANKALDGATVSFSGEVVGDVMAGGSGHKWLNVLGSDGNCVGVWVDEDMANRIVNLGSYSTTGTTVQVRGIYSIDCDEHQGELDVHAIDIRILDAGGAVEHYVDGNDVVLGLALSAAGFLLLTAFILLRVRSDRRRFERDGKTDEKDDGHIDEKRTRSVAR